MTIGKQANGGDGSLLVDGEGSTLDYQGDIIVADSGKGVTLAQRLHADRARPHARKDGGSDGTVELQTSGANQFGLVVDGDLTVGDAGRVR